MEYEALKSTAIKTLKKEYYSTVLAWITLFILNEFLTTSLSGVFADNGKAIYVLETITILVTAGSIPLALKLFSKYTKALIPGEDINVILKTYIKASRIRLAILSVSFVLAIITSHLCISSSGTLCAILIGFTAFFCSPTPNKLNLLLQSLEPQSDEQE